MKQSNTVQNIPSSLKSGSVILTVWYEDLEAEVSTRETPLLVITRAGRDLPFDDFCATIRKHKPRFVVPPFSQTDQHYTSAAAERVRSQGGLKESTVGIVMVGTGDAEELEFLVWAHAQNYSPIVIPPDRRPRSWQINQMFQHGVIGAGWYHLVGGDRDLDVSGYPGLWTFGEAL